MLSCNVVRDLLPSYLEHLTSSETNIEIEEHMASCPDCREVKAAMLDEINIEAAPKPEINLLKKLRRKQIIGAIFSAVITLFCLYGIYSMEFRIDVSSTASLEEAIDEYFFTMDVDANIIESQKVGNRLLVFFEREGYDGHYGLAYLEPGIFGKYRFRNASLTDWPFYGYNVRSFSGKHYLILFGINDLPDVSTYAVFSGDDSSASSVYEGEAEKAPFLRILETDEAEEYAGIKYFHYYDSDGKELGIHEIYDEVSAPAQGELGSVGTAETELVYVFMGIVLVLGIIFIRYFLTL